MFRLWVIMLVLHRKGQVQSIDVFNAMRLGVMLGRRDFMALT